MKECAKQFLPAHSVWRAPLSKDAPAFKLVWQLWIKNYIRQNKNKNLFPEKLAILQKLEGKQQNMQWEGKKKVRLMAEAKNISLNSRQVLDWKVKL